MIVIQVMILVMEMVNNKPIGEMCEIKLTRQSYGLKMCDEREGNNIDDSWVWVAKWREVVLLTEIKNKEQSRTRFEENKHDIGYRYIKTRVSLWCAKWDVIMIVGTEEGSGWGHKFLKYQWIGSRHEAVPWKNLSAENAYCKKALKPNLKEIQHLMIW